MISTIFYFMVVVGIILGYLTIVGYPMDLFTALMIIIALATLIITLRLALRGHF